MKVRWEEQQKDMMRFRDGALNRRGEPKEEHKNVVH